MQLVSNIKITTTGHSKLDPDSAVHSFGQKVSDHMLICDYSDGDWNQPQILPFGNLSMSPTTLALHYGQTVFEGIKAFATTDDKINIFRIDKFYERFLKSLERMCMPELPWEIFEDGICQLVNLDRRWVPHPSAGSLYIRPFMYATDEKFGVHISDNYRFIIFTGPVGDLYSAPLKVKVETKYIRAAKGGTGYSKCGGNYGGSLYPTRIAKSEGYDQILWTDAEHHQYIEESGTMNVLFVIDGVLISPPVSETIINGVTRDSLLVLAKDMGIPVQESPVSIELLKQGFISNTLTEAFGAGTAAVIAPIALISIEGTDYPLPGYNESSVSVRLKKKLKGIRTGVDEDAHGWNCLI